MQIGNMKVFPNANRRDVYCCMCGKHIVPKAAYVHHYKVASKYSDVRREKKPGPYRQTFTKQLYFCSLECVTLKGIEGVYEDG